MLKMIQAKQMHPKYRKGDGGRHFEESGNQAGAH